MLNLSIKTTTPYISIKEETIIIPLKETPLNIVSYNCTEFLHNFEVKSGIIKVVTTLSFKVLYTTKQSTTLSIFKYNTYHYTTFNIKGKIQGLPFKYLKINTILTPKIKTLKLSFLSQEGRNLIFSSIIKNEIEISPYQGIIYIVSTQDGEQYLYSSHMDFSNFTQLNFEKQNYSHISFSTYNHSLFFLKDNEIYNQSFSEDNPIKIYSDELMYNFVNIGVNTFLIFRNSQIFSSIVLINTFDNSEKLLYKCEGSIFFLSPTTSPETICFLVGKDNLNKLTILTLYGEVIFSSTVPFIKAYINEDTNLIIGQTQNDIHILDRKNNCLKPLTIPIENFTPLSMEFFSNTEVIILGKNNEYSFILIYDVIKLQFKILHRKNCIISSLSFDDDGNIYFSSNELGLFNLYKMTLRGAPKLSMKLYSDNLSILIRR